MTHDMGKSLFQAKFDGDLVSSGIAYSAASASTPWKNQSQVLKPAAAQASVLRRLFSARRILRIGVQSFSRMPYGCIRGA